MSHERNGNIFLHLLSQLLLAVIKLIFLTLGWCIKGMGHILTFLGEIILKYIH